MNAAKIRLSQKEMDLVTQGDWILTKNHIIEKTIALMASLQLRQEEFIRTNTTKLPVPVKESTPKISRGEKYKGLPYVMLDYPRLFAQKDTLAVRTLFWWGNFFSVTLHLAGTYKKIAEDKIATSYHLLSEKNYYCCTNDLQWEHDLATDNYTRLAALSKNDFERIIREKDFIKLVARVPLEKWEDADDLLLNAFRELIQLVGNG